MGDHYPRALLVLQTQPNPQPAQALQPHWPGTVLPWARPSSSAFTTSQLRLHPLGWGSGSQNSGMFPSWPCSGSFGRLPPPPSCELHEDRDHVLRGHFRHTGWVWCAVGAAVPRGCPLPGQPLLSSCSPAPLPKGLLGTRPCWRV